MEKLMYGANQAATSPTAVSFEYSKVGESVRSPMSIDDNPMDDLMYGAQKATASPTAVPITMKSKKKKWLGLREKIQKVRSTTLTT